MELESGALLSTKEIGVRASRWPSPSIVARHDMKVGHLFARCLAACALKQPPYFYLEALELWRRAWHGLSDMNSKNIASLVS